MALTTQEETDIRNVISAFKNGKKVGDLASASSLSGIEVFEVVQGGFSKKTTLEQILATIKDGTEPALAEVLNHLVGRISSLETFIANSLFKNIQVDNLSVVKNLNIFGGTNLVLIGTASPTVTPDTIGQFFINTTAPGTIYQSYGNTSSSQWKQISN